jgi:hypothetical protein
MSWLYVPGTEASASASSSPSPECVRSVTWRGKHSAHRYWCDRWKRGGWIRLLSGLTSPLSMLDRGAESWISSLRDSRVSLSRQRASDSPNETPATSGQTSPASSPKQLRLWSSLRTSHSEPSSSPSETFEQWASASRRQSDALRKTWALRTGATAGSYLLPTPTVGDSRASGNRTGSGNSKAHPGTSLTDAICRFPTPSARDWKSGKASATTLSKNARPLNEVIEHQAGGALNPTWVEWLMGLPLGWTEQTDSALSETEWCHWLRRMRGAL